ncbi:DUF4249 domain-containing protein [Pollutibacter soli]|uniref:DUF4249 domain-containing protein n=1 Tax=Pollutibacter soli TaxID=3034157 RepID=UPI00301391FB
MKAIQKYCLLGLFIVVSATSCIKDVEVPLRFEGERLVVEGQISNEPGPYNIRLTLSGAVAAGTAVPEEKQVTDAQVSVRDDQGKIIPFVHTGSGFYQSDDPSFIGEVGRSYSADIRLADGRNFISLPEKILTPVQMDSFQIRFVPDYNRFHPAYFRTYIYTTDPADQENYYKWEAYGYTRRKTLGVGCGFYCIMFDKCLQYRTDNEMSIMSDADINGGRIIDKGISNSYIFDYGTHFIDFSQLSISKSYFQFLQQYVDQVARTGSIFDPLPASIKGNIVNAANQNEYALGYFSARSAVHKKVIITPYYITEYLLDVSANAFFERVSQPCFDVYPDAVRYDPPPAPQVPPPPGWENADSVRVNFKFP